MESCAIGLGPTPMLYYAGATLGVDGGVMVTGTHNPPDYNGFKIVSEASRFTAPTSRGSARWPRAGDVVREARAATD